MGKFEKKVKKVEKMGKNTRYYGKTPKICNRFFVEASLCGCIGQAQGPALTVLTSLFALNLMNR